MKRSMQFFIVCLLMQATVYAQPPSGDGPPRPPSAEERLKHVTEKFGQELQLNAEQKQKLSAAYKSFFADMEKLRRKEEICRHHHLRRPRQIKKQ
jgi:hypothetical protein